jgi:predicted O-methyltransferase YrrM
LNLKVILHSAFSFFEYWLLKEDRYSQHSPFIFTLYGGLENYLKTSKQVNFEAEEFRRRLLLNHEIIEVNDLGAGSKRVNLQRREIRQIAKFSTSSAKFCGIYQYFCQMTPARQVLELGTGLGISTRYLSRVTRGKLFTIEGAEKIWEIAQTEPKPPNTEFILGDIHHSLPLILSTVSHLDFVLIDANHTHEGTLTSFFRCLPHLDSKSILVIGDIHWSRGMEKSWEEIKNHPSVKLTIDFFECGVVFFDYSGAKSHLVLAI